MKLNRTVLYRVYIPAQFDECRKHIEGTGRNSDFIYKGEFHAWGVSHIESEQGFGNYSVALVKIDTGEVVQVPPQDLKFI